MTRIYAIVAICAAVGAIGGGLYYMGASHERGRVEAVKARDKIETIIRVQDADIGKGDDADNIDWVSDFIDRL